MVRHPPHRYTLEGRRTSASLRQPIVGASSPGPAGFFGFRNPWLATPSSSLSTAAASVRLRPLTTQPARFAALDREVHDQARHQADLYVAGLLAKAGELPEMAQHVDAVIAAAEIPLRAVEKKNAPWWSVFWAGWRSR